jgi:Fic family protein
MHSNINKFYEQELSPEVQSLFNVATSLNDKINALKNNDDSLWSVIAQKLKVDWTYHSNSLEGSTLTLGETFFFLKEGLTVEGKPFKDFLDARNHAEAIDYLYEIISQKREVSESVIKEINALLLSGVTHTLAQNNQGQLVKKQLNAGEYKKQPNHVLQSDGTIHWYIDPLHVKDQMEELVAWVNHNTKQLSPIYAAAVGHYNLVRIHAFDDGNGRGARIFMNLILITGGFFPVVIRTEKKRKYLESLSEADKGDLMPFIRFIASELIETYEKVLQDLTFRNQ